MGGDSNAHPIFTEAICKWPDSPVSNGRSCLCTDHVCVRSATNPLWVFLPFVVSPPHFAHFSDSPLQDSRNNFKRYARAEFQKHLSVNKKDFSTVEYLLRKGHRQLEMYASPGIRNIS
ncbi:hypothetical protein N7481_011207 [Penicillium waksmanii]|uniref:uncharacterized protein n=1 Tax=Penicillium waksmanii TaxID=69791 RepID=UPI002547203E|nr:uncharacterized protein N7481_011207 [Penicillium waksmanii]KAJ5973997.1 hypothetical protein N7481_011207 [Penicillium waksmanii]